MNLNERSHPSEHRPGRDAEAHIRGFDNRKGLSKERLITAARRLKARIKGTPEPIGSIQPHFWFESDGRRFVYAYVYKNACTAFKNFIVDTSPFREREVPRHEKIAFLARHHGVRSVAEIGASDFLFFVHRDPVQRFASLYKNKFIVRDGNVGVFGNIRELSGNDPDSMSAHDLLLDFLPKYLNRLDRQLRPVIDHHFLPQRLCIGPLNYAAAIAMENLYPCMAGLIGEELATRYFKQRANASAHPTLDENVSRVESKELHRRYLATGLLPSDEALISPLMAAAIRRCYATDFAMKDRISGTPTDTRLLKSLVGHGGSEVAGPEPSGTAEHPL